MGGHALPQGIFHVFFNVFSDRRLSVNLEKGSKNTYTCLFPTETSGQERQKGHHESAQRRTEVYS